MSTPAWWAQVDEELAKADELMEFLKDGIGVDSYIDFQAIVDMIIVANYWANDVHLLYTGKPLDQEAWREGKRP